MAIPSSTFTEMVSTTLRDHPSEIADNVSEHNALYRTLKNKGKITTLDGGYEIVRTLDYAENSTYQRYSGYEPLNVAASDVLTAVRYNWVQAAVHVTASGLEMRNNSGKSAFINMVKAKVTNAKRTAANNMSLDIYSDGSLTNQMGGLSTLIQTNGEGTVGGINSATWTFWKNQYREISGTNTWSKSTIRDEMQALYMLCTRGTDMPDLIVSSHDFYAAYWGGLTDLQRYASQDKGKAGFQTLEFGKASVIFDSNTNFTTTAERMYFLNTDHLEMVVHRQANWNTLDEKMSVNQDAVVIPIIWQGQMIVTNRSLQGILIDAS